MSGSPEGGSAALEYALLVTLIAIVAIAGIRMAGSTTSEAFHDVGAALSGEDPHTDAPPSREPAEPTPIVAPALWSLLPDPHGSGGGGGPVLIK